MLGDQDPDQPHVCRPSVDLLSRGDAEVAADRLADAHRLGDQDLAVESVARDTDKLTRLYCSERVAALRPGKAAAIECVERRWSAPGMAVGAIALRPARDHGGAK